MRVWLLHLCHVRLHVLLLLLQAVQAVSSLLLLHVRRP